MSAILGLCFLNRKPVSIESLERMSIRLTHRGIDSSGFWIKGSVGLGQRALWTTPESRMEEFPLRSRTEDLVLTADARLDNRDELMDSLGIRPPAGGIITDGELILRAYEEWEDRCAEKLLGDYAFAIWDNHRRRLFCARDPLGVRSLFYWHSPYVFAFATEIKALFALREVSFRLNESKIRDYLLADLGDRRATFYQDVYRLLPGHYLSIENGRVREQSFWKLEPSREIRLRSNEEYAEAFRSIFQEAVRCRLRSIQPIGSLLSGGLDSSSIVCTARRILREEDRSDLRTFSAIFQEVPQCDERLFIDHILAQGGLEPYFLSADRLSPLEDLDRMLWHEDEPFLSPNLFIHWGLYRKAQSRGIRVLLDGLDGDTTVSHGLLRLAEIARNCRLDSIAIQTLLLSRRLRASPLRILWRYCIQPLIPESARRFWRRSSENGGESLLSHQILNSAFSLRMAGNNGEAGPRRPARTSKEHHLQRLSSGLIPYALEIADRAAAAFSLEPRYPFFDRRLVEFCLALPADQKLSRGWTRMVLRRAMTGSLPKEICWRGGKSNLQENFDRGLWLYERNRLESVIFKNSHAIRPYVNLFKLQESYRCGLTGGTHGDALRVWRSAILDSWLRRTGFKPTEIESQKLKMGELS